MTQVANVRSVPSAGPPPAGLTPTAAAGPAVVPPSVAPSAGALNDALSQLYLVVNQQRDAQANLSKGQSDVAAAQRTTAMQKQEFAMKRAQEAASQGGLFDSISKDIGVAGAVGLVTYCYALVAASIVAHELGLFDHVDEKVDVVDVAAIAVGRWDVLAAEALLRKTDLAPEDARKLLDECGIRTDVPGITDEDVQPVAKDLVMANLMVLSLAATVLTAGSTAAFVVALVGFAVSQAGTYVARNGTLGDDSDSIGLGMQIGGAVMMTAASCGSVGAPADSGTNAVGIASGAATIAQGADRVVVAVHEHERDVANMNVAAARHRLTQVQRMSETILEQAKDANESHRKAAETIQNIVQSVNATHEAMARGVRA